MGENITGFLTDHQQKHLWDLVISFNTQEAQIFQMKNKLFFAINTGALESSVFHSLIIPPRQRENRTQRGQRSNLCKASCRLLLCMISD